MTNGNAISYQYDYRKIRSYYRPDGYFDYSEILGEEKNIEVFHKYEHKKIKILPIASIQLNNLIPHVEFRVVSGINVISAGLRFAI